MQQKKNIKLAIVLLLLIAVTAVFAWVSGRGVDNSDKALFALEDSALVDQVLISNSQANIAITRNGRQWFLNDSLTADLTRINDLFIVLSEISVRRKAGKIEQEELKAQLMSEGAKVKILQQDNEVATLYFMPNAKGTLSYVATADSDVYIVHIPGHNYHIASLFAMRSDKWRSKYVFAANWTTLEKLEVQYANENQKGFSIVYDSKGYFVPGVAALDTTVMYSYLEQVSYLKVNHYLDSIPSVREDEEIMNIAIKDIDENNATIRFYDAEGRYFLGRINEQKWATFDKKDMLPLFITTEHLSIDNERRGQIQ